MAGCLAVLMDRQTDRQTDGQTKGLKGTEKVRKRYFWNEVEMCN